MIKAKLKVYETSEPIITKNGQSQYYMIEGKLGNLNGTWVSMIELPVGENFVHLELNQYNGKLSVKITETCEKFTD